MARKKQRNHSNKPKQEEKATLRDQLDNDILSKLKEKKQELKVEEKRNQEQEEERLREERRQREKNKSFEELLSESHLDWKNFK